MRFLTITALLIASPTLAAEPQAASAFLGEFETNEIKAERDWMKAPVALVAVLQRIERGKDGRPVASFSGGVGAQATFRCITTEGFALEAKANGTYVVRGTLVRSPEEETNKIIAAAGFAMPPSFVVENCVAALASQEVISNACARWADADFMSRPAECGPAKKKRNH